MIKRKQSWPRADVWVLVTVVLFLGLGCERRDEYDIDLSPTDRPAMRLITLAPALTQIVVDMGLGDAIVGVGEHDAAAPGGAAVVGNYLNVNREALIRLEPTHILMMVGKEGVPDSVTQLAQARQITLVAYPVPHNIEQLAQIIFDEGEVYGHGAPPSRPSLATVLDAPVPARTIKYRMLMQLGALDSLTAGRQQPRVLMVIGTRPTLMASGPDTVLDNLLTFAGGHNAAAEATVSAPVYDRETLLTTVRPQVVLLILPGAPPLQPIQQDERLAVFRGLDVPAVREGRILLIDDPVAHLPSSQLARVAAIMVKAIHPDLASEVDRIMAADEAELASRAAALSPLVPERDITPAVPGSLPVPVPGSRNGIDDDIPAEFADGEPDF